MKIAIPTDDELTVRARFSSSRGFLVVTAKSGKIVHEEMRWNLLSEMMTSMHGYFYNLTDCDAVIVKEIGDRHQELLLSMKKNVARTRQTEIHKAIQEYLVKIPGIAGIRQVA